MNDIDHEGWHATHAQLLKSVADAQGKLLAAQNETNDRLECLPSRIAEVLRPVDPTGILSELQMHFAIPWEQARNLANVLQERNLWPKCSARQGLKRTCILFKGHIRGHVFEP
jgi:hypothetical protein